LGYAAAGEGNAECTICPQSSYADVIQATVCSPCPAGRITPTPGATSVDQCVSPINNFASGITVAAISLLLTSAVFYSSSQKSSHLRSMRLVQPITMKCKSVVATVKHIKSSILMQKVEEADKAYTETVNSFLVRILKCTVFFIGAVLLLVIATFVSYLYQLSSIFYSTFILWV